MVFRLLTKSICCWSAFIFLIKLAARAQKWLPLCISYSCPRGSAHKSVRERISSQNWLSPPLNFQQPFKSFWKNCRSKKWHMLVMIVVPSGFGVTVFHTLWFSTQTSKLWMKYIAIVYEEHSGKTQQILNNAHPSRTGPSKHPAEPKSLRFCPSLAHFNTSVRSCQAVYDKVDLPGSKVQ